MAKIHVEEDWSKEADENPFLSGGIDQYRRGAHLCIFESDPTSTPAAAGRRGRKIETSNRRKNKIKNQKKNPLP